MLVLASQPLIVPSLHYSGQEHGVHHLRAQDGQLQAVRRCHPLCTVTQFDLPADVIDRVAR